jgi:diguanylate cyclase
MYIRMSPSRTAEERGLLHTMAATKFISMPSTPSGRNLLLQELRETLERARLGGFFYPIAAGLAFLVTGPEYVVQGLAITGFFALIAIARLSLRVSPNPGGPEIRSQLLRIWSLILLTTFSWGAFSAWSFLTLPEPAPLVAVLFSGAFGMALAHSMCMRRIPAACAIASVMLPSLVLLWRFVVPGVALMWVVYMAYMLLVLMRSFREYRTRLELEEDLRRQRDLFETQSLIDSMTGIANRRAFTEGLAQGLVRARKGGRTSLLILDIDHFKRVNDTFGHSAGDACLVAMAQRLKTHFDQPDDGVFRLGGEEFGVILNADEIGAFDRADRFRKELESEPLSFGEDRSSVTVSIGCGSFDPEHHSGVDAFYREVDAALYRSKLAGRNRTERAERRVEPVPAGDAPAG